MIIDIDNINEEYLPNEFEDDDNIFELKTKIQSLDQIDRAILLLYLEYRSMSEVGKLLHVSSTTIFNNINRIRQILKN